MNHREAHSCIKALRGDGNIIIKNQLEKTVGIMGHLQLNDLNIDSLKIASIMINEVVPSDPAQDFYG